MGSRGASSGLAGKQLNQIAANYEPYAYGQITRREAGTIYRAVKNGDVTAKPETVQELYNATNSYIRYAQERYMQDHLYYERVYNATRAILNEDYKEAQEYLNDWERDNIQRASRKSKWYKYQTDEDRSRWGKYN